MMLKRRHQGLLLCAAVAVLAAAIAIAAPRTSPAAEGSAPAATPAAKAGKGPARGERRRQRLWKQRRANRRQKRPNVIVITTDDQDKSLEGMTNVLGLLSAQGTTFTNSYAEFPLCCPSRATFLTGQYAHNHGVLTSDSPEAYNSLQGVETLPVWLRKAGYRTAMVGKYLNGYGVNDSLAEPVGDKKEIPPGWSDWYALTGGSDQRRYRYKLNENGDVKSYGTGPGNYVTDVLGARAVDFVKRRAPNPKPFFLWFTPTAPHGENGLPLGASRDPTPAPRHLGRYEGAVAPRTPNFDEADVSDKPQFVRDKPQLTQEDLSEIDRRHRGRLESLLAVDDAVKRIVGRVRKAGDMRKTYVIFTSDNGLQMGAHRLLNKAFLYEESTRVPLVIRGPGFPAGTTREQLVSNVDLAPTIVALTKAKPGLIMDGRSLVPFAADGGYGAGREALLESFQTDSFAIRRGDYIYIEHDTDELELYDLAEDPFQLESLHEVPGELPLISELSARLADLRDCAGAACP
jgi:N-acetylglucosamine-6-sulfatase